ncbi:MAG: DUF4270 family protein [Flavobacteriia bacterium]|nr:DUF4270 family protein [Flavobacteriia bacterium]
MEFINSLKWRKGLSLSATFLLALFVFTACKKKESKNGKDVLPSGELINSNAIDTFQLKTFSIFDDSVNSSKSYYNFLGSYNDPKFGIVNAGFYTQLRLSGLNPIFDQSNVIVVDSFILGLQYAGTSGYYGELSSQKIGVYEITENLYLDSNYYAASSTNCNFLENLVEPGTETFTPDPINKTTIDTTKVPAQLRVKLKNQFAQDLISHCQTNPSDFASQSAFVDYFKGLYIRVENPTQSSGKGAVLYFDTKTSLSKMTIYYKENGVKKRFDFLINNECADYNKITFTRASSNSVETVINDTVSGQKEFYAQAYGIKAKIEFPGLSNLSKKTIIHRAILELPIEYQAGSKYNPGDYLDFQRDLQFNSPYKVNYSTKGYYDYNKKAFIIDLRLYAQEVVSKIIDNTGIYVFPDYYNESLDRIILNGLNTINKKKPKLTIKYTEF